MASSTTPRTRHHPATPPTSMSHSKVQEAPAPEKNPLQGIWKDGQWWCNCEPRKKAALREVKKNSPNKGKFFWTCATRLSCDFFLWRDDALLRQSGDDQIVDNQAVPPRPKTPTFTQKPLESYGIQTTPSRRPEILYGVDEASDAGDLGTLTSVASPSTPSSKRKRNRNNPWVQDEDDFTDLDSEEERQLADMTDRYVQRAAPHCPSDNMFTTPSTNRRTTEIIGGLPTPSVSRTLFPASETKRSKKVSFEEPTLSNTPTTPPKTPSSQSSFDLVSPPSNASDATIQDVTKQVMALLSRQKIDPAVLQSVEKLLLTSAQKTRAISMGRDSVRAALKESGKTISQLQEKIRDLEEQVAYNHKRMTNVKAQLIRIYEEN